MNIREMGIKISSIAWLVAQLYYYVNPISMWQLIVLHLCFSLVIVFLTKPAKSLGLVGNFFDIILIIFSIITSIYYFANTSFYEYFVPLTSDLRIFDRIFGWILIALMIEGGRRSAGLWFAAFILVFVVYMFVGKYIPIQTLKLLSSTDYLFQYLVSTGGIYSTLLIISATYVYPFVFFGSMLSVGGMGEYFIKIGLKFGEVTRGGSAKASVIASALFGSISGSAVANVSSTGIFTIPLMKKQGFQDSYAAGVESVASSFGQLMPPIMGAAAFIIAQTLGIGYLKVAVTAILPALLTYFTIFIAVDCYALKHHIEKLKMGVNLVTLLKQAYYFIPLIVLIIVLIYSLSAQYAVYVSLVVVMVIYVIQILSSTSGNLAKKLKSFGGQIMHATVQTGKNCSSVGVLLGVVAIPIAVFIASAMATTLPNLIVSIASGNLILLALLAAILALLFGMGMPTTAAYLLPAIFIAPTFNYFGLNPLSVHLFLFYYAILSNITPPVALACYAGAAVSGAPFKDIWKHAIKIGGLIYIIPFCFLLDSNFLTFDIWTPLRLGIYLFLFYTAQTCLYNRIFDKKITFVLLLCFIIGLFIITKI